MPKSDVPAGTRVAQPKVAILLCTYNGQNYLAEQLDSFAAQTHTNWEVWASDDGSLDDTHAILEDYRRKWPVGRLSIHFWPATGFASNFLSLAYRASIEADYFAYSDQDDVWEANKLAHAVEWLNTTQRQSAGSERLFSRSDDRGLVSSLFAALSIAGWLGYFPLAHSFHTQLFMAPMFVLLALQLDQIRWKSQLAVKGHWPVIALLSLTMATLVYQAHWHIRGLHGKVTAPSVVLRGEMPASGLRLAPDHALSYNRFYNALLAAQESAADPQLIPMSVDPLRALLPIVDSVSSDFKMGLNWTFPNEIVEPSFNKRLAMRIADRKSPVYADSLIGIPGYVPVALLEMPSPMTASHTLYVPSADHQVVEPPVYVVHNEVVVLSGDAFPRTERAFLSSYGVQTNFTFIELDNLVGIPSDDIGQLHVSIVRLEDIPSYLSKFQYERYIKAMPGELAARVAELYERKQNTRYELRWPLEHGQTLDIAKFLLSQGKLFEAQDRPMYFTTLGSTVNNRPFLVWKLADEDEMRILWAKPSLKGHVSAKAQSEKAVAYFMAIPSRVIRPNEESILYVQVVMKDYTTQNFYLHYLPT
ncbi:glycosyltransferase [Laribacter hongkongensis]|uniref:glycosyltransferase n=1 Tax=Laribacter hongkongensis TaxID=168471 RepID=UPI001EFEC33A|nr:glycosyltransferase [Laribacter hongkongensis]MCG9076758.1 glycosyltransferase [Laribacter hongkongensis]